MTLLVMTGVSGYKSIEDIPNSCTPSPLVPDNGRCLFSYQCASGFCCPFFKSCLGDDGYEPLSADAVAADPLRKKMMWTPEYGGEATCGSDTGSCDICAMRGCTTCDQCITVDAGDGAKPMLEGNDFNFPPYDIADPGCKCHADFIAAFKAGTWVEGCGGGATEAAADGASPAAADGASPPAATADKSICGGLAWGSFVLVASALTLN